MREILDILKIGAADGTDGAVFKGKGGIASAVDGATAERLRAAYLAAAGEGGRPRRPTLSSSAPARRASGWASC